MTPTRWQARATCTGHTHLFYPPAHTETEREQTLRESRALAMCDRCPVIDDCRQWLENEPLRHQGDSCIAAGTTPADRNPRLRRQPELFDSGEFVHTPTTVTFKTPEWERTGFVPDERDALVRAHRAETELLATIPLSEALALFEFEQVS